MADHQYKQTVSERQEVRMPDERTYYINIPLHPLTGQVADEHLKKLSLYYALYSIVFGIVGLVAIVLPYFIQFPTDQLIAYLLVAGGIVTLIQFFVLCGAHGTTGFLLLSALHLCVGAYLLLRPVPNSTWLIFIIAAWFILHGFLKLLISCQVRQLTTWPAVLVSGLISVILAFVVLALSKWLFQDDISLLGIFFGADLILTSIALLLVAWMARLGYKAKETHQPLLG